MNLELPESCPVALLEHFYWIGVAVVHLCVAKLLVCMGCFINFELCGFREIGGQKKNKVERDLSS